MLDIKMFLYKNGSSYWNFSSITLISLKIQLALTVFLTWYSIENPSQPQLGQRPRPQPPLLHHSSITLHPTLSQIADRVTRNVRNESRAYMQIAWPHQKPIVVQLQPILRVVSNSRRGLWAYEWWWWWWCGSDATNWRCVACCLLWFDLIEIDCGDVSGRYTVSTFTLFIFVLFNMQIVVLMVRHVSNEYIHLLIFKWLKRSVKMVNFYI